MYQPPYIFLASRGQYKLLFYQSINIHRSVNKSITRIPRRAFVHTYPVQDDDDEEQREGDRDVRDDLQNPDGRLVDRRPAVGERRSRRAVRRHGTHQQAEIGEMIALADRHPVTRDVIRDHAASGIGPAAELVVPEGANGVGEVLVEVPEGYADRTWQLDVTPVAE